MNEKADEVFTNWMEHKVHFYKYPFDDSEEKERLKKGDRCSLMDLITKFDTMKYFRLDGTREFPTIAILARIHFSTMHNAAFQERVFFIAADAQKNKQGHMKFALMEKRTLLSANRELIRAKVI